MQNFLGGLQRPPRPPSCNSREVRSLVFQNSGVLRKLFHKILAQVPNFIVSPYFQRLTAFSSFNLYQDFMV